jgi:hypothetical protein
MARKRLDNTKWQSRPSRKKRANLNKKPSKIRKNNSKPSQQRRKVKNLRKNCSVPSITLETNLNEEVLDTPIVQIC